MTKLVPVCSDCDTPLPLDNLDEDDYCSRCTKCGQLWDLEPDGRMYRVDES